MNWPDVLAVVLVVLAAVSGLRKGFWLELVFLLGVCLAVLTSAWLTPKLSVLIPGHGGRFHDTLRAITFVVVALFFVGLYQWLGERTRGLVPKALEPLDRLLGLFLGAAKGVVLAGLVFLALLQPLFPGKLRPAVRSSHAARAVVLADAIVAEALATRFPALRAIAHALSGSLLPDPAPVPGGAPSPPKTPVT
ncbi:MAG: CvpA family protein [Candidatus Eisenbacteria bacterium]|nr:CvpA family protein [Candidatus Eisenbacteria bacterium]